MENFIQKAVSDIALAGLRLKGPIFYSLNNVPFDGIVDIEVFVPLFDNSVLDKLEGYIFSSYWEIQTLLGVALTHDFETLTELAYAQLLTALEEGEKEMRTPFYHILQEAGGQQYLQVLVGY